MAYNALTPRMNTTETYTAYIKDVKANTVTAGASTAGSYLVRTLNTLDDPHGITSLSSNRFTLQAGTYQIEASSQFITDSSCKIKLYNFTDSTDAIIGQNGYCSSTSPYAQSISTLMGTVTIASAKEFQIMYRVGNGVAGGLGSAASFGDSEVYTQVKITKIGST